MASTLPPVKGAAFSFALSLVSQADTDTFQDNPTLAAGDVKVVKDGVLDGNIDSLPTAVTSLTRVLNVTLSADEMTADRIDVLFHDAAGSEWQDALITIYTAAQTLDTTDGVVDGVASSLAAGVTLADDAITSAKFDESTAFPLKAADAGITYIMRTGADGDTAETLSDQLDAVQEITDQLDVSEVTQVAASNAGHLTITQGRTFSEEVTGLTIPADWVTAIWTLKNSTEQADTEAIIQLRETNPEDGDDGLQRLNAAAVATPITAADGDLKVDQPNGSIGIYLTDELTALLSRATGLGWDVKFIDDAGDSSGTRGTCDVVLTETKATA